MTAMLLTLPVVGVSGAEAEPASPATSPALVSSDPVDWMPNVLGAVSNGERVMDIAEWGDVVVAVGRFSQVKQSGTPALDRTHAFAFDAETGAIDPDFAPVIDGQVDAVEVTPDGSVLLGGYFENVNGELHRHIVKLDRNGQVVPGFTAWTSGSIRHIEMVGSTAYLGGEFFFVNGVRHELVAAIDSATGAVDSTLALDFEEPRLNPDTLEPFPLLVRAMDVSDDGSTMVVGGSFRQVDSQPRVYIAVIDLTTNQLSPWRTTGYEVECRADSHPTPIWDVSISPDGSYVAAVTTILGAIDRSAISLCDSVARFDLMPADGTDVQPTWVNWSNGDSITAVEVADDVVYVGGHMRWMNGFDVAVAREGSSPGRVDRPGLVALDPRNGVPFSWRADREPRGAGVWELKLTDRGLWVGSDTDYISGEFHPKLALLPRDGGAVLPTVTPPSLPTTLYEVDNGLTSLAFDGTRPTGAAPVVDAVGRLETTTAATMIGGVLHTTRSDLHWLERTRFDGTTLPQGVPVDLNDISSREFGLQRVRGLTFDHRNGRLYYTYDGQDDLLWRGFVPESGIIEPTEHVADTGSLAWGSIRGLELIDGRLYYGHTDGDLRSLPLDVEGVPDVADILFHDGPAIDGRTWDHPLFATSTGTVGDTASLPTARLSEVIAGDAAGESWFSLPYEAVAGETFIVSVSADDPTTRFRAFAIAPDGVQLARDRTDAPNRSFRVETDQTGRHRIGIKYAAGASRVRVTVDAIAPDGTGLLGHPANLERRWTSYGSATERRWQPFDLLGLTGGETVTTTVSWDNQSGDVAIFAYAPDGTKIVDIRNSPSPAVFDITPPADGRYRVAVAVRGELTNYDIDVVRTNVAPVLDRLPGLDATVGEAVAVQFTATDADGDPLRFTGDRLPPGLTLSDSGLLTGTPTTAGRWVAEISVDDRQGGADSSPLAIEIIPAPATLAYGTESLIQPGDGSGGWVPVVFDSAFDVAPVVVAGPVSYAGEDPAVARVRNVTTTGFELSILEWPGLLSGHSRVEDVSWLAVAPGSTSLGGLAVEAGRTVADTAPASVVFGGSFAAAPVVLAQTDTEADSDPVDVRIDAVSSAGFTVGLTSAEARPPARPPESIGWIAIEAGEGALDGHRLEVGTVDADHTGAALPTSGPRPVALLADLQTTNDGENAAARVRFEAGVPPVVWAEEDDTLDIEVVHGVETIGFLSLSPLLLHGTVELDQSGDGSGDWVPVMFGAEFAAVPVVVAGPPTADENDATIARVRNVTTTGFELSINEWAGIDEPHVAERVSWLAVLPGQHTIGGVDIESGRVLTSSWKIVRFGRSWVEAPVVFSQVDSVVNTDPVATRKNVITADEFQMRLTSAEARGNARPAESIGWIAIEPGEIDLGLVTIGVGTVEAREILAAVPSGPRFPGDTFLASTQTQTGSDNGSARVVSDPGVEVGVFFQEDTTEDSEVFHSRETMGWVQISRR